MKTQILQGAEGIRRGAEIIRAGGVVAFPTETVYGLGANALLASAVMKIFAAKNRPADNPLIVHICENAQIYEIAEVGKNAEMLMRKFMPGPLTLVLKAKDCVPSVVTAGLKTVGVRVPSHPVAREFLRACACPVAAPSANLSTKISPTTAQHVFEDMNGRIPLIIDGGECEVGIESTVLSLAEGFPVLLRPGFVTAEEIEEVLGEKVQYPSKHDITAPPAPGMKYRHYAPQNETVVAKDEKSMLNLYQKALNSGKKPIILATSQTAIKLNIEFEHIVLGESGAEVAKNLYSAMRAADGISDYIIFENLPDFGVYGSAKNRILKAAGGVIK